MTLQDYLRSLDGKRVAVIGIGVSNLPLLRLLLGAGIDVTACDRKDRAALGPLAAELEGAGCRLRLGDGWTTTSSSARRACTPAIWRRPGSGGA